MKKIIALVLVVALSALVLVACTPATNEKDYTLAIAVEFSAGTKMSNTAAAIVFDAEGKIVAARFDCAEVTPVAILGAITEVPAIVTKAELGAGYPMTSGTWAEQTKAFEDAIVGKTAEEVADLDMSLVAGCTMPNSPLTFKALVTKAAASTNKVSFKAAEGFKLGFSVNGVINAKGQLNTDFAAVVIAEDKIIACGLDSNSITLTAAEDGTITAGEYKGTKTEQGEGYVMPAGTWAKQGRAFADAVVGLTAETLATFEPVSDALAAAGCTMKNTTAGYKATIIKAFGYAK